MRRARHLAVRFAGSLSRRPPASRDEVWALGWLLPGERALWWRMAVEDRRHAVLVARRFRAGRPGATRAEMAAALLHDCGKVDVGLGTVGRVVATVWIGLRGRRRVAAGHGRFARYADHDRLGARLVASAGGDPVTVALVARHPDAPPDAARALADADDV